MLRPDGQQVALPPLPKLPAKEMAGPTPWSNWVLPGRVIAGAYPASLDDAETERILTTMLELGINTFVCLQAEVNINTPEHAWRSGHGLRPYIKDAQKILSKAHETGNPKISQQKIDFLHLPIIDGNVTTDSAMNRLVEDCMERILRGEKLYVHCWGGHGRTGTLIAVVLGRLYGLPYTTALRYTQAFHDSRIYPQGVRSPQTPVQRAQVRRLLASQSAMASSTPASMAVQKTITAPARASTNSLGLGSKSPSSILAAGAPSVRQQVPSSLVSQAEAQRQAPTPQSPLRSRPAAGVPTSNGRYPVRSVGDSPLKASASDRSGQPEFPRSSSSGVAMDRLSSDFSRMQAPSSSGLAGSASGRSNGLGLPYVLPQSRTPPRGSSATNLLRRSVQEVNVR